MEFVWTTCLSFALKTFFIYFVFFKKSIMELMGWIDCYFLQLKFYLQNEICINSDKPTGSLRVWTNISQYSDATKTNIGHEVSAILACSILLPPPPATWKHNSSFIWCNLTLVTLLLMVSPLYAGNISKLSSPSLERSRAVRCDFSSLAFPRKSFTAAVSLMQPNKSNLEQGSHQNVFEGGAAEII